MFNEAKLRGINMRKLRQESFTSPKHIEMMKLHEARAQIIWDKVRWPDRPLPKKIPSPVAPTSVVQGKVKEVIEPTFTDNQIRIAQAALKIKDK
jgi:hypothetical protein